MLVILNYVTRSIAIFISLFSGSILYAQNNPPSINDTMGNWVSHFMSECKFYRVEPSGPGTIHCFENDFIGFSKDENDRLVFEIGDLDRKAKNARGHSDYLIKYYPFITQYDTSIKTSGTEISPILEEILWRADKCLKSNFCPAYRVWKDGSAAEGDLRQHFLELTDFKLDTSSKNQNYFLVSLQFKPDKTLTCKLSKFTSPLTQVNCRSQLKPSLRSEGFALVVTGPEKMLIIHDLSAFNGTSETTAISFAVIKNTKGN